MKIGELEQHCGNCEVIEYCGEVFGYCLCSDERFEDIAEATYTKIAYSAPATKNLEECEGCERIDCTVYGSLNEECEYYDEHRDYFCEQIADYVESVLKSTEIGL